MFFVKIEFGCNTWATIFKAFQKKSYCERSFSFWLEKEIRFLFYWQNIGNDQHDFVGNRLWL